MLRIEFPLQGRVLYVRGDGVNILHKLWYTRFYGCNENITVWETAGILGICVLFAKFGFVADCDAASEADIGEKICVGYKGEFRAY